MMWPCSGIWVHSDRNVVYSYHAGQDLLGDWTIARYWGPADKPSGRRQITVHNDEYSTLSALVVIVQRKVSDGYKPVVCSVTERLEDVKEISAMKDIN